MKPLAIRKKISSRHAKTIALLRSLLLLPTLSFFVTSRADASFSFRGADARIEAMGGAGVALNGAPFGIVYNPAAGGGGKRGAAGIAYSVPFGEASLETFHAAIVKNHLPFDRDACAALSYQRHGYEPYRETAVRASYSKAVTGPLRAGVTAGLLERDAGKTSSSAFGLDLGFLAVISDSFSIGGAAFNLNSPEIGESGETVTAITFAGAAYRPADGVLLTAAVENRENSDARLHSGGEVLLLRDVALRAGFTTNPETVTGGVGFTTGDLTGDIAVVRHPDLGAGAWYAMSVTF
ncbi:hypothetical protein CHL67_09725 [Prosthecochloris sp. GSB1]|uniref:conjugal transfer protein TraF n=1 Tax=Prosthecochloris sp. GSB1 TaxID=281093 RepID=UPI000B8CBAFE|nr:conjugal transfer protein TraF [Prosthecochloris sp. GSB1]ASQ91156.1 hypothetical protein CHL67_09725 [Prosthecochloris sp. GSB1]